MSTGNKIKKLREELGLRQFDVSKALNMTQSTWANYETDVRQPKNDTLVIIADYFNVPSDYLIGAGLYAEEEYSLISVHRESILRELHYLHLISKMQMQTISRIDLVSCTKFLAPYVRKIEGDRKRAKITLNDNLGISDRYFTVPSGRISDADSSDDKMEELRIVFDQLPEDEVNHLMQYARMYIAMHGSSNKEKEEVV